MSPQAGVPPGETSFDSNGGPPNNWGSVSATDGLEHPHEPHDHSQLGLGPNK